jgi:DNA-binding CsgD family transcriptional regulator
MKRHVLLYGLIGGILIAALKWTEYRFLVIEHSLEIYGGLIAATFAILGIWLGLKLTRTAPVAQPSAVAETVMAKEVGEREIAIPAQDRQLGTSGQSKNWKSRQDLGITPRELEILELIAKGMSNREIAQKLYVSENTVKTHSSRVFDKLGARRRTQAVQMGKEFGLLS